MRQFVVPCNSLYLWHSGLSVLVCHLWLSINWLISGHYFLSTITFVFVNLYCHSCTIVVIILSNWQSSYLEPSKLAFCQHSRSLNLLQWISCYFHLDWPILRIIVYPKPFSAATHCHLAIVAVVYWLCTSCHSSPLDVNHVYANCSEANKRSVCFYCASCWRTVILINQGWPR